MAQLEAVQATGDQATIKSLIRLMDKCYLRRRYVDLVLLVFRPCSLTYDPGPDQN